LNVEVKCSTINLKRARGFYIPKSIAPKGIVEYEVSISLEQIFCFLQLINLKIDLEFDI
jgi:hypothetical protein